MIRPRRLNDLEWIKVQAGYWMAAWAQINYETNHSRNRNRNRTVRVRHKANAADKWNNRTPPAGFQIVSESAIRWLHETNPEAYQGFYERVTDAPNDKITDSRGENPKA